MAILFKWCKNRCYACFYGIILMLTWPIIIAFGAFSVAVTRLGDTAISDTCNTYVDKLSDQIFGGATNDPSTGDVTLSLEIYENIYIDRYMCSSACPCLSTLPAVTQAQWTSTTRATNLWNFKGTYTTYKACVLDETNKAGGDIKFQAFAKTMREQKNFD